MPRLLPLLALAAVVMATACGQKANVNVEPAEDAAHAALGQFNADSAYQYIVDQLACGPRVPGTEGHAACAQYITDQLTRFGAEDIIEQRATVTAYNGDRLPIVNIMGRYNVAAPRRILLAAHWDTRPWADQEADLALRSKPIPGANDGGSGVAVLLEIARNLGIEKPSVGVDILFLDAEDYGSSDGFISDSDSWCLGSQSWVKNMPYAPGELPVYGILLDMVGGKDAIFDREYFSHLNATKATDRVWSEANALGLGKIFINSIGGAVTDDHIVLTRAGIPTTDIIETLSNATASFPATWHTHQDNLDNISKKSLDAVGQTVLTVVYKEKES